jgi:DNA-binding response OmpR family regulator
MVHRESVECRRIAEHLRKRAGADVEITMAAPQGMEKIASGRFDLALVHAILPETPAVQLATVAANRNTPVLWLSENQSASARLRELGYQYLEKPINCDLLAFEAALILTEGRRLVREVAATACKMEFSLERLRAEIVESYRMFDSIVRRLGHKKV